MNQDPFRRPLPNPASPELDARFAQDVAGRAHAELRRVLRAEVAQLLEEAALLCAAKAPFGVLLPCTPPATTRAAWIADARSALAILPFRDAGSLLVEALCSTGAWPGASCLAQAAVQEDETDARWLALGRSLLAEGSGPSARQVFSTLLTRNPQLGLEWRAYAGLAVAHESEGNDRLALGAMTRAMDLSFATPNEAVDVMLGGLFLALLVGDVDRSRRATSSLQRFRASNRDIEIGFSRLLWRVEFLRGGLVLAPAPATARAARELARTATPGASVARLILAGGA